ncbi:hypothetical protein O181_018294 [Austropuccinia psidii MF-1]|uniref:Uncharacterized protein n=1 Tax=Austropuccinia psidii MF-1 TaxID=1389203 RepID=A0A9Q3C7F5_9BASI|nr:hypothetical protein [Austropuccinia psidii MF-1]
MSPVHLRDLGFQRSKSEGRAGLSRSRRPARGHLGHSAGWKDTEGNHTHSAIHFPFQQEPQTRGLERYGSSSSAPPTPQRPFSMEHGQQEAQPGIPLGRTWSKLPEIFLKEIDFKSIMVITEGLNPTRQFRLLEVRASRIRENQATIQAIEEQMTQTGNTHIPSGSQGAGQISSLVASYHSETNRSVAKSHHYSKSQEFFRRRQGYKAKKKTTFNQRKRESDLMIKKLLDLVKEVHKNQK